MAPSGSGADTYWGHAPFGQWYTSVDCCLAINAEVTSLGCSLGLTSAVCRMYVGELPMSGVTTPTTPASLLISGLSLSMRTARGNIAIACCRVCLGILSGSSAAIREDDEEDDDEEDEEEEEEEEAILSEAACRRFARAVVIFSVAALPGGVSGTSACGSGPGFCMLLCSAAGPGAVRGRRWVGRCCSTMLVMG